VAMVVNVPVYAALLLVDEFVFPEGEKLAFLHYMAVAFAVVSSYIVIATLVRPLKVPVTLPVKQDYPAGIHPLIAVWSVLVLVAVVGLYVVFR
jgi:solute:Na+ symporter, SSS family